MITIKTLLQHIQTGDLTTFPAVLEAYLETPGANLNKIGQIQIDGEIQILTPLMMATKMGQINTVSLLLKYGADINAYVFSSIYGLSTSGAFAKSVQIWDPSPTATQLALTELLVKEGAACSKYDFLESFYKFYTSPVNSNIYAYQRSLIYKICEKAERFVPDFALNDEQAIKIERIQHNNKVSKYPKKSGFELARQTPFNADLSNIVNDYLFTGDFHKILTYEFNRARANPSLTECSEDEVIPTTLSRCSIS